MFWKQTRVFPESLCPARLETAENNGFSEETEVFERRKNMSAV